MPAFTLPTRVCFGPEGRAALGELSGRRVLVVTDQFLAGSGLLENILAPLSGCTVEVFDQVTPDPSLGLVAQGVARLQAFQPDAILAFGGGSPMDCAKAMRHFAYPKSTQDVPPLYAVPTTAGTGSEVTSFAVLTDTERGVKYPLVDPALLPQAAILEPSLLAGVPPAVTADTGMDVLTHAAEAYVAKNASPFSDALALAAFAKAWQSLPAAHGGDLDAKGELMAASCMAGISFNAAGLGVCHALAHALGGQLHLPHGRINAVLLPHVIRLNDCKKYGDLAAACSLSPNPRSLASAVARMSARLGLPDRLPPPPKPDEAISAALTDGCLPTNPKPINQRAMRALLREVTGT